MEEKSSKAGPILFIAVAALSLIFFWWLLLVEHGGPAVH